MTPLKLFFHLRFFKGWLYYNYGITTKRRNIMTHTTTLLDGWNYIKIDVLDEEIAFEVGDVDYDKFIIGLDDCTTLNDVKELCERFGIRC
jgi:hypothetical protein